MADKEVSFIGLRKWVNTKYGSASENRKSAHLLMIVSAYEEVLGPNTLAREILNTITTLDGAIFAFGYTQKAEAIQARATLLGWSPHYYQSVTETLVEHLHHLNEPMAVS